MSRVGRMRPWKNVTWESVLGGFSLELVPPCMERGSCWDPWHEDYLKSASGASITRMRSVLDGQERTGKSSQRPEPNVVLGQTQKMPRCYPSSELSQSRNMLISSFLHEHYVHPNKPPQQAPETHSLLRAFSKACKDYPSKPWCDTYIYIHIHICIRIFINMYIYTFIYVCIHIGMHTCTISLCRCFLSLSLSLSLSLFVGSRISSLSSTPAKCPQPEPGISQGRAWSG